MDHDADTVEPVNGLVGAAVPVATTMGDEIAAVPGIVGSVVVEFPCEVGVDDGLSKRDVVVFLHWNGGLLVPEMDD